MEAALELVEVGSRHSPASLPCAPFIWEPGQDERSKAASKSPPAGGSLGAQSIDGGLPALG